MPLYNLVCSSCKKETRKILGLSASQLDSANLKCSCGAPLLRSNKSALSAQKVESLDNGIMTKKIERLAEAERLFDEYRKTEKDR